ncbi:unnamed protein product [Ranitomeya imitator]|uniref:Phosphotyrosine protein phosphatase I domain-containing protein n=1 Tax=Ranitomeya imitator TaxID=111125 RepID=A0ABN9LEH7_9NEOB|nr:unnamed protein product [Ranitomeya imitator]
MLKQRMNNAGQGDLLRYCCRGRFLETELPWNIDSAATATYKIGNPPDYRGQNCMKKHGVSMNHTARQITNDDFLSYDYILCMDENNLRNVPPIRWSHIESATLGLYSSRCPRGVEPHIDYFNERYDVIAEHRKKLPAPGDHLVSEKLPGTTSGAAL